MCIYAESRPFNQLSVCKIFQSLIAQTENKFLCRIYQNLNLQAIEGCIVIFFKKNQSEKEAIGTFTSFHRGGFGIPAHPFFRGLLYLYGDCLHDLTMYKIIHLAILVALCECFLGVTITSRFGGSSSKWSWWRRMGTVVIWLRLDTG
jgi:hypothetical protein